MARNPNRLARLVRLARRNEQVAQHQHARANADAASADQAATDAEEAVGERTGGDVVDFAGEAERLARRADRAIRSKADLQDRLADELAARQELLAASRRRKGLERVEGKNTKIRAVIAAQAAQRALDETAAQRHRGNGRPRT